MKRPEPPCKINGLDCTKRKVGCRTDCEGWQKYEGDMKVYRQVTERETKGRWDAIEYHLQGAEMMRKRQKKRGYK